MRRVVLWCAVLLAAGLAGCGGPGPLDFALWPGSASGYEIEELPVVLSASYARGNDVYWGLATGEIQQVSDANLTAAPRALGHPLNGGPRLLFATSAGVLFVSADHQPLYRSADTGQSWQVALPVSVWRMDEDDAGTLYAGTYTKDRGHVATVYRSRDGGVSWADVFHDETNDHVHTVRWDARAQVLYIALGDGRTPMHETRAELYSADHGDTFQSLAHGPRHGHTDVAFTDDYLFWCSDDQSGRVFRVDRNSGGVETVLRDSQFVWFGVADDTQVYVGTMTSRRAGGERATLLASDDQGQTWQKLLESSPSAGPYSRGFLAESRQLSAGGWLYCTLKDDPPRSFRVRHVPS
jgi:hypothetical protein